MKGQGNPSATFVVELEDLGGILCLRLRGDLDYATAPHVEKAVSAVAEPDAVLIIDLGRLTFFDSSGIRLLVELAEKARRERWELRLLHGPPEVRRVLRLTGMEAHLPFVGE